MTTETQLKQEIEELEIKTSQFNKYEIGDSVSYSPKEPMTFMEDMENLKIAKAKLSQLQEVLKIIDEVFMEQRRKGRGVGDIWIELTQALKGKELK